jgi:hypothetical protein
MIFARKKASTIWKKTSTGGEVFFTASPIQKTLRKNDVSLD